MRAKFFTRTAGGFDIFTAALRVTNKIAARVAAHKRHIQRPAGEANEGYPRQLLFKEVLIHRNMLAEQHAQHHDVCPAVVVADQQIPVLFVQAFQTWTSHLTRGLRCNSSASPSHQQYIIKLQKTDIERHTAGMGTSSLISPATMIGTEQIMVTKMVKAILSGSVIAASNLDIVSLFRKLG